MADSNLPTQITILLLFMALSFSSQDPGKIPTPDLTLIQKVCSNDFAGFNSRLCFQILRSHKKISSATNFFDLSVAIMEAGISKSTNIGCILERKSNLGDAVFACHDAYLAVNTSLRSALTEVRDSKEYKIATYDLLLAGTDNIQPCKDAVAMAKVTDEVVLSGNEVVPIYALSAYHAVCVLDMHN